MPTPAKPWAASAYDRSFSFVANYGRDLLPLLEAKPGERILDLGCGTGTLTAEIAASGAKVIGLDADAAMLKAARKAHPGITFLKGDAQSLALTMRQLAEAQLSSFTPLPRRERNSHSERRGGSTVLPEDGPFDAVFSNAALHWMLRPRAVVRGVARALKPGGRFVAEMGGYRNIGAIAEASIAALRREGIRAKVSDFWYFPTVGEYTSLLESEGFTVRFAAYFDRMTPLEGGRDGMRRWLQILGTPLLDRAPAGRREAVIAAVERATRAELLFDGRWHADYRRLRFVAVKG